MADLYGGEVILRVRAELVPHRRELRLYVLCRCGSGAWLARVAPFEELFFDRAAGVRPLCAPGAGAAGAALRRRLPSAVSGDMQNPSGGDTRNPAAPA